MLIEYQGFRARSVTFRRRRGYQADVSELLIPVASFPGAFSWELPAAAGVLGQRGTAVAAANTADIAGPLKDLVDLAPVAPGLPGGLSFEGSLTLATVDRDGLERKVSVPALFVVRVDNDWHGPDGTSRWVKLTLVDERFFWPRGMLERWRFNVSLPNGELDKSTADSEGRPLSLDAICDGVAKGIFRQPRISHTPPAWSERHPETVYPPFGAGVVALQALVASAAIEEPCLRLDGTVALHERGDGRIGYAPDGKGANAQEIPDAVKLAESGQGQGAGAEATYLDDYVVVVGLARVATVAVDNWEPVLMIHGVPFFLSEELVRKLTDGRMGLEELQKFVLLPQSAQFVPGVSKEVLRLFSEQAYRRYRLPGVDVISQDVVEDVGVAKAAAAAGLPGGERTGKGFYSGESGPNAHLLPLLPRAETINGKRQPVDVEAFGWTIIRKAFTAEDDRQRTLVLAAQTIRDVLDAVSSIAIATGKPNPIHQRQEGFRLQLGNAPPSWSSVASYMEAHRRVDRIKELSPQTAQRYEKALADQAAARGPVESELFKLAKDLVAIEAEVEEADRESLGPFRAAVDDRIKDAQNRIRNLKEEARNRTVTEDPGSQAVRTIATGIRNEERSGGQGRVVSAELGVIATDRLPGHVAKTSVATPSATSFVPRPVRVVFGATMRPRVDVPAGRVATGDSRFEGETFIPEALTDKESLYTAAFKRSGRSAEQIHLGQVPLHEATRVGRPFRELVPLGREGATRESFLRSLAEQSPAYVAGGSNREQLDAQAQAIAEDLFDRPERVDGRSMTLGGPWPVQCDGIIQGIEIRTEFVTPSFPGATPVPAGFTTTVSIGGNPPEAPSGQRTRTRGAPDPALIEALNRP